MTRKLLDCIEITTAEQCDYSVIWLHGLGASGHDFEPIVPELRLLQRPGVRFLFPHAPALPSVRSPSTAARRCAPGTTSPRSTSRSASRTGTASRDSAAAVADLIEHEIERGVPASRITLAGFSQGGAMALYCGLAGGHRLGGILALSCYLPLQSDVLPGLGEAHRRVPVFMAHGVADEVVQLRYGEQSRAALEASGVPLEWHTYPISHSVSADEVADISSWLKRQFGM